MEREIHQIPETDIKIIMGYLRDNKGELCSYPDLLRAIYPDDQEVRGQRHRLSMLTSYIRRRPPSGDPMLTLKPGEQIVSVYSAGLVLVTGEDLPRKYSEIGVAVSTIGLNSHLRFVGGISVIPPESAKKENVQILWGLFDGLKSVRRASQTCLVPQVFPPTRQFLAFLAASSEIRPTAEAARIIYPQDFPGQVSPEKTSSKIGGLKKVARRDLRIFFGQNPFLPRLEVYFIKDLYPDGPPFLKGGLWLSKVLPEGLVEVSLANPWIDKKMLAEISRGINHQGKITPLYDPTQRRILTALAGPSSPALSYKKLLERVWPSDLQASPGRLGSHIHRINRRSEQFGGPQIASVRTFGYKIRW